MARKRLSDLVRQEAGEQPTIEAEAHPISEEKSEKTAKPSQSPPQKASDDGTSDQSETPSQTELALQKQVQELQATLAQVQQREQALQQQNEALRAELQAQINAHEEFEKTTTRLEEVKAELEEAKKVILQLSAINKPPQTSSITPVSRDLVQQGKRNLPYHYEVQKAQPTPPITEQDLGWVD
jgi:DNA repair exonuclease SbcCD ATPase subunit